jgi:antitoxin (DNA-binding transcriptional repressor) of toxin-antitoxin stability system
VCSEKTQDGGSHYISATEARKQISSLVKQVIAGSIFVITDDETGDPIAELVPVVHDETEIQ